MTAQAHDTLFWMLDLYTRPMIGVAARLGIPDMLKDGELTADELAARTKQHPPSLARMMRALAARGVVRETPDGRFGLTELSDLLRSDVPGSLRALAMYRATDTYAGIAQALPVTIETGEPATLSVKGQPFFEAIAANPAEFDIFNAFMASGANPGVRGDRHALAAATHAFEGVNTFVDVGGGRGQLVAAALQRHSSMKGVLFDRAPILAAAPALLARAGVADRADIVPGDFFEAVPAGGDAYGLSLILHDWDDDDCRRILKNIRAACSDGARVLIIERLLPASGESSPTFDHDTNQDINMMVLLGGRERTEDEFRALLLSTGFQPQKKHSTSSAMWVLEGVAV